MRSVTSGLGMLVVLVTIGIGSASAQAQCTHLIGAPPPVLSPILASKIVMKAGGGGLFGDGNDRYKILKGILNTSTPFDPISTHTLHVTIRRTDAVGPTMLSFSLPPVTNWTTPGPSRFIYNDTSAALTVRRAIIKGIPTSLVHKFVGRNASIAAPPLVSGDTINLMIEFESGGVGECYEWTMSCWATPTVAACG